MRTSCLINSFNYGPFVGEAVESVLGQTARVDQIVVVDDGSTDGSLGILRRIAAREPRVCLVEKENGGQLSTFNAAHDAVTGEVVFFLDADDLYEPQYVERMLRVYRGRPDVGFAFCGRRVFGLKDLVDLPYAQDSDLGYSVAAVALAQQWIGGPTSCISMRRDVLRRVLPLPELESTWTISADVCLVTGASLAGARKYYVAEPLVRYRSHRDNRFYGKPEGPAQRYTRRLHTSALVSHYVQRFRYDRGDLARMLHVEFGTIPQPTARQLKRYTRFILAQRGRMASRSLQLASVLRHYWRTRRSLASETTALDSPAASTPTARLAA